MFLLSVHWHWAGTLSVSGQHVCVNSLLFVPSGGNKRPSLLPLLVAQFKLSLLIAKILHTLDEASPLEFKWDEQKVSLQSGSYYPVSLIANRPGQDTWNWEVWCWFNIYNGLKVILYKNCGVEACQTAILSGHSRMSLKHLCWVNQWNFLILAACWNGHFKYTLPYGLPVPESAPCTCWVGSKLRAHLLFHLSSFCVAEGVLLLLWITDAKCFVSMPL